MFDKAVILAAGHGDRLWPYNETNAKAALSIGTRPLIQWQLDALSEVGVKTVCVVVGHLSGMVRSVVSQWLNKYPSRLEITFAEQKNPTGSADALLLGMRALDGEEESLYVVPGDLYFHSADLQTLSRKSDPRSPTLLVGSVDAAHVQDCIRVEVEDEKVSQIRAHSREFSPQSREMTGLMALPTDFLATVESTSDIPSCVEIGGMAPRDRELAETLHQWLGSGGEIRAVQAERSVIDINKPWDFLEANRLSAQVQNESLKENILDEGASIDPSARIEGFVRLGKGSLIGPGVTVYGNLTVGEGSTLTDGAFVEESVVVGDGCQIWRGALVGPRTVIGHGCNVGHGAEFEGVMLPESYSYHYGEFWGILGRCSDLGAATVCGTLRFDDGQTLHRIKGRKETPRYHSNATYLGDYVRTGVNAILMPGVKVGPYSLIGAGVLLSGDVPSNTSVFLEQTQKRGTWGPERYGW